MGVLRLFLALSVVIGHSSSIFGYNFIGGELAVKSFYIISGFYMSLVLNEKYINKKNSYKLFITSRFLRLYPVYWIVLFLTILFNLIFYYCFRSDIYSYYIFYLNFYNSMNIGTFLFLMFTNIFLFFQDIVMFLGLDISTGSIFFTENYQKTNPQLFRFLFIPPAWTIGIELTFYLIAPFIVRRNWKTIIVLILASLILRFYLYHRGLDFDPWTYRFFPTELVFFLLGNISYLILKKIRTMNIKLVYSNLLVAILLIFTLFYNYLPIPYKMVVYLTCFFVLLPFVFNKTMNWKWDIYIGELSYPIYISHMFILLLIFNFKYPFPEGLGLTLAILTILFSILLNRAIMQRIEVYRQKRISVKS